MGPWTETAAKGDAVSKRMLITWLQENADAEFLAAQKLTGQATSVAKRVTKDQLVELYLHQNAITTGEDGAFDGLSRLEFVKLGPSQLDKGFVTCADVAHQLPARAVCEDE